jgi:hypothetical protein
VRVARTLRLLVDEWGWPVVPGAFTDGDACSCADPSCPEPGRHALADASWLAATSDAERARDRWRAHPEAAIVLPVGPAPASGRGITDPARAHRAGRDMRSLGRGG